MPVKRGPGGAGWDRRELLRVLAGLGLGVGVAPLACVGATRRRARSVIWIVIDTLRADHVGCYGSPLHTPTLDGLAARGVRFERAYAHAPLTLLSHTAMFSSRYPFELGVHNNADVVPASVTLFGEHVAAAGYDSYGVVSLGTVNSDYGIAQGFDVYRDSHATVPRIAEETCGMLAEDGAEASWQRPFLLFLHLADPHFPYRAHGTSSHVVRVQLNDEPVEERDVSDDPRFKLRGLRQGRNRVRIVAERPIDVQYVAFHPDTAEVVASEGLLPTEGTNERIDTEAWLDIDSTAPSSRRAQFMIRFAEVLDDAEVRRRYGLEVEYADRQLGQALETLEQVGLLDGSLVVFTADHGEGLGNHALVGHKDHLYEEQIHVPLILVEPDALPAGHVVTTRVRHVDVVPTITGLLGLPPLPGARGLDLRPLIEGHESEDRPVISATFRPEAREDLLAFVDGDRKLIVHLDTGRHELFDIRADPRELTDLAEAEPDAVQRMSDRLAALGAEAGFPTAEQRAQLRAAREADAGTLEMLRALGYVDGD